MSLLSCQDVSVGYKNNILLTHLTFDVNPGDYLCIIGENGAGKSTLIRSLLGLQPLISGKITFGDGLKPNEIRYLPQQTAVQRDFPASVREIVLSGCQGRRGLRPYYNRQEKELADFNMERLGILDMAGRCYHDLSGGQQQRVLLSRALCATQKMLLLDEPVAGLDPNATGDMYQLIRTLNELSIAVIMISHDVEAVLTYATHILFIGKEVFYGTKDEYLKTEKGRLFLIREKEA